MKTPKLRNTIQIGWPKKSNADLWRWCLCHNFVGRTNHTGDTSNSSALEQAIGILSPFPCLQYPPLHSVSQFVSRVSPACVSTDRRTHRPDQHISRPTDSRRTCLNCKPSFKSNRTHQFKHAPIHGGGSAHHFGPCPALV